MPEPIDDIITVCARFVTGWRNLGLPPPEAVHLASHADGMRIIHEISQRCFLTVDPHRPPYALVKIGGAAFCEAKIYGLKLRWPATLVATAKGDRYV